MSTKAKRPRLPHPMQPIVRTSDGVVRFQPNAIVAFIVDALVSAPPHTAAIHHHDGRKITFNDLMAMPWSDADRDHFNQLHGYSVSGLPWRSRKRQAAADAEAQKLRTLGLKR